MPQGTTGPIPVHSGKGLQYTGGRGGHGFNPRVTNVRMIMAPTLSRGPSPGYPGGYVSYSNRSGQTVHPYTGRMIAPGNPLWHLPLNLEDENLYGS